MTMVFVSENTGIELFQLKDNGEVTVIVNNSEVFHIPVEKFLSAINDLLE